MKYLVILLALSLPLSAYAEGGLGQCCNASGTFGGSGSKSGKSGSGSKNDKAGSGVTWSKSKYDTRGLGYSAWSRHHYN